MTEKISDELKVLRAIERKLKQKLPLTAVEMEIATSRMFQEGFKKYFK